MAAILMFIGVVILLVFGGLYGVDSRDGADWSRPRPRP